LKNLNYEKTINRLHSYNNYNYNLTKAVSDTNKKE